MHRLILLALLACPYARGAANLVINGLTINSNGQFVVTFSPCVSPLSLSSGTVVTGVTPYTNGFGTYTVQSSSISGCTLTVSVRQDATLTYPVFADNASPLYLSITTASNLQDASGNTVSSSATNTTYPSTSNNSTWYEPGGSSGSSKITLNGSPAIGTSNTGSVQWMSTDGCLSFNASWSGSSGGFNVLSFNYTSGFVVFEDGAKIGSQTTTSGDAGATSYSIGGTLSGTHTYEVCENLAANGYYILYGIQLTNGTFNSKPAQKKLMFAFGASEVACQGLSDTTTCAWWLMARTLGYADQHFGVAGWPVTPNTFGGTTYPSTNLLNCAKNPGGLCSSSWANFNFSGQTPNIILVIPGGNDALDSTLIGSDYTTAGYYKGDSVGYVGNLVTTLSATGSKIVVFDEYYLLAEGGTCPNSTAQTSYQSAWQGAGAAYAASNPSYKVSTFSTFASTCSFTSADYQSDHLHLTGTGSPSGQQKWANIMLPYLYGFAATPSVSVVAVGSPE